MAMASTSTLRVVSWNVDGLFSIMKRRGQSLDKMLDQVGADIICIQETKLNRAETEQLHIRGSTPGWAAYYALCTMKSGYSGCVTFCRRGVADPIAAEQGLTAPLRSVPAGSDSPRAESFTDEDGVLFPHDDPFWSECDAAALERLDSQGRAVILDFGSFALFNIYNLAVTDDHNPRFRDKLLFGQVLERRVEAMRAAGKAVLLAGDFNIAVKPLDHCDYVKSTLAAAERLFYQRRGDRVWLVSLLERPEAPWRDLVRELFPTRKYLYTVWPFILGDTRSRHRGSRVDYIFSVSPAEPASAARKATCAAAPHQGPTAQLLRDETSGLSPSLPQPLGTAHIGTHGDSVAAPSTPKSSVPDPNRADTDSEGPCVAPPAIGMERGLGPGQGSSGPSSGDGSEEGAEGHPRDKAGVLAAVQGMQRYANQPCEAVFRPDSPGEALHSMYGTSQGGLSERYRTGSPSAGRFHGSGTRAHSPHRVEIEAHAADLGVNPGTEATIPIEVGGIGKVVLGDIREPFGGSNHAPVRVVLDLAEPLPTGHPPPALAILGSSVVIKGPTQTVLTTWLKGSSGTSERKRKARQMEQEDTPPRD
eukprot:jgi/Botrbrau1/5779/Bobra.0155s0002.1